MAHIAIVCAQALSSLNIDYDNNIYIVVLIQTSFYGQQSIHLIIHN